MSYMVYYVYTALANPIYECRLAMSIFYYMPLNVHYDMVPMCATPFVKCQKKLYGRLNKVLEQDCLWRLWCGAFHEHFYFFMGQCWAETIRTQRFFRGMSGQNALRGPQQTLFWYVIMRNPGNCRFRSCAGLKKPARKSHRSLIKLRSARLGSARTIYTMFTVCIYA
jgi:hypothetical protein